MGGACGTYWGDEDAYRRLMEKTESNQLVDLDVDGRILLIRY